MEKKMGFFEKLKKSLSKAGNGMLGAIFAGGERVNNEFYEELEEAMIVADMGMDTAERLIDALRDSLDEKGIKTRTEARQAHSCGRNAGGQRICRGQGACGSADSWR